MPTQLKTKTIEIIQTELIDEENDKQQIIYFWKNGDRIYIATLEMLTDLGEIPGLKERIKLLEKNIDMLEKAKDGKRRKT